MAVHRLIHQIFGDAESRHSKRRLFLIILGILAGLSLIFSIATKVTFIAESEEDYLRVAVAGPMTGDNAEIGRSMMQGAQLYVDMVNEGDGIDGVKFSLDAVDDGDTVEGAREAASKIADSSRVSGVIGHWASAASLAAGAVYSEKGVPAITPNSANPLVTSQSEWLFSALANDEVQTRFLANYVRNVLGQKLVTIIQDEQNYGTTIASNFEATFRRFGTAIRYNWSYDVKAGNVDGQLNTILHELKEKRDAGTLFLAMNEQHGARFLRMIRDAGIKNPVVAPNFMATAAFMKRLDALAANTDRDPATYTDKMLMAAPILFDTANELAQDFKTRYRAKFGEDPDWVAAYAYDAARLLVEAHRPLIKAGLTDDIKMRRMDLRDELLDHDAPEKAIDGVTGPTWFDGKGEAQKPVLIGVYNGRNIISALTQLQPIAPGSSANYIQELKKGRVLYVNDRFMYKTNVVYTGLQVNEISEIDTDENQYTLEFLIWFRYRGTFEPQDLNFANAVEPITLETPIDERKVGDMIYRLYRVKAKFNMDFTDTVRAYGTHVVGLRFTHDKLNRNNLLYVVDVLGLGLEKGRNVLDTIEEARALNPGLGWNADRAWISQDVSERGTKGDPTYVGFGSTEPAFSKIDLGILLTPAEINARDFIPGEFFVYIAIFGVLGSVFAVLMDRKEKGRFWTVQSWGLRVAAWPAALLAVGNLLLDFSFQHLEVQYIDVIVLVYKVLWWVLPARLLGIAMERFIWRPLEDHTERNIPNVIRVFASVVIYSFASFGVIAFVFDQQLTSLLASTGLLAMIVGLAIQANISNIFSGIVINLERPFSVGDWVRIGDMDEGRVIDITWRTTRVKTRNGYVISLPNGQVSEAQVHNFNSFDCVRLEIPIFLDADVEPEAAQAAMMMALEKAEDVLDEPEREVRFKGIVWQYGWVSEYEVQFWIGDYGPKEEIAEGVLGLVYKSLRDNGMSPSGTPNLTDASTPGGAKPPAADMVPA